MEDLGLLPWEADRLTPHEARLLLSGANKRLVVIVDTIEAATVNIVSCLSRKGGEHLKAQFEQRMHERHKK